MGRGPVLVLQMQRMGDLVLSFPLLLWLARCYPGQPLHVVGEESFYRPLMPFSPHVAYISWRDAMAGALTGRRYRLLANLSIREEAARLAGSLEAEVKVGPVRGADGALRVRGAWQLYRASLVGQGRHNRFHWADLNALDMIPLSAFQNTFVDPPRPPAPDNRAVGLFVGASEPGKRPSPEFFAGLARALLDRGLLPTLLGGPDDRPVAQAVRAAAGHPLADLTGRLSLTELAEFGRKLALFVTPDTGPMHLAAWTGTPVLNLSVGHVNPWDTGPYQPGHLVLRSGVSCAHGCWTCRRSARLCERRLAPGPVAALASLMLRGPRARLEGLALPGLELYESGRTEEGLFRLRRLGAAGDAARVADLAAEFWRRFFLWRLSAQPEDGVRRAWEGFAAAAPRLAARLPASLPALGRGLARLGAGASLSAGLPPFWRPLSSWLEMRGHNEDLSPAWARESMDLLASLAELTRPAC